jgi:PAP2 superfamily/Domain of unknown function (DUF4114)
MSDNLLAIDSFLTTLPDALSLSKEGLGALVTPTPLAPLAELAGAPALNNVGYYLPPQVLNSLQPESNFRRQGKDITGSGAGVNVFNGKSGVFTVGSGGFFSMDVLSDGGAYEGQIGVFSLTGMEDLKLDSKEFAKEAAQRAIRGNGQGYLLFDDGYQGARFDGGVAGGADNYAGATTVSFQAGEKVALILVPNGELSDVARGRMGGDRAPLFSIAAANKKGVDQLAKIGTNTFGWEDLNYNSRSCDKDFNDLVIKVAGASAEVQDLTAVTQNSGWLQTELGQKLSGFASRSNGVLEWGKAALAAIKAEKSPPPLASRNLAIVSSAVFDAVNGLSNFYENYKVENQKEINGSAEAAAIQAAYQTLVTLYPNQQAVFDALLASSLGTLPSNNSLIQAGLDFGKSVAQEILAARATDGFNKVVPYTVNNKVGNWQPTSAVTSPLLPQWGGVTPFALESGSQFRPEAPPALTSAAYAQAFNTTKELGAANSNTRTADQTQIAQFWADGGGTYTPPGHWGEIAMQLLNSRNATLVESAHTMAMLNISLADVAIACWDAKYTYNTWRPLTAIQQADLDGNDATIADPNWKPLLTTPPFPEFTSGHSTFSGAAATILSSLMGNNVSFTANSVGLPGITRSYTSFQQAAEEAGLSRIYGGIHFMPANLEGLSCGRQIGAFIASNFMQRLS